MIKLFIFSLTAAGAASQHPKESSQDKHRRMYAEREAARQALVTGGAAEAEVAIPSHADIPVMSDLAARIDRLSDMLHQRERAPADLRDVLVAALDLAAAAATHVSPSAVSEVQADFARAIALSAEEAAAPQRDSAEFEADIAAALAQSLAAVSAPGLAAEAQQADCQICMDRPTVLLRGCCAAGMCLECSDHLRASNCPFCRAPPARGEAAEDDAEDYCKNYCAICLDRIPDGRAIVRAPCHHGQLFCHSCAVAARNRNRWLHLNDLCPYCCRLDRA